MLLTIPYNGFAAVLFALILFGDYLKNGTVPLAGITDYKALTVLILSGLVNFWAQVSNFYAY